MAGTVEIARRIFQVVRAAIAVGEWNAVDLAGEGSESGFVGMSFASQSQGHHGAAVEGVFKGDDAGALGVMSAGDLD